MTEREQPGLSGIPIQRYVGLSHEMRSDGRPGFHNFPKMETGMAGVVIDIDRQELDTLETWERIAQFARKQPRSRRNILVVGGGTNLFITGGYIKPVIVRTEYDVNPEDLNIDESGLMVCPAGATLDSVIHAAAMQGRDITHLAGIPGTVGGATSGNAGVSAERKSFGDFVVEIVTFDLKTGKEVKFNPRDQEVYGNDRPFFGQRTSHIKEVNLPTTRYAIRSVTLDLSTTPEISPEQALANYERRIKLRKSKNDEGLDGAGSPFANAVVPEELLAQIREVLGLEDSEPVLVRSMLKALALTIQRRYLSGARFTDFFAFLVTTEKTKDKHVARLLHTAADRILKTFGFYPQLEIVIVGEKGIMSLREFVRMHEVNKKRTKGSRRKVK